MMRSARPVPRLYKMYQRRWAASEQILTSTDVGRMLELATLEQLQQWGMQLTLAGGRGDKGIDLKGTWPLRQGLVDVIVQVREKERKSPRLSSTQLKFRLTSKRLFSLHGKVQALSATGRAGRSTRI